MAVALMLAQYKRAYRSGREALSGARARGHTFLLCIGDSGTSREKTWSWRNPCLTAKGDTVMAWSCTAMTSETELYSLAPCGSGIDIKLYADFRVAIQRA